MSRATLESLEANAKSTRTAYETFVSRLRDVQGQEAMQLPDASVISWAAVPRHPNSPARSLIVLASLPIGLLLGLLLALLRDRVTDPEPRIAPAPAAVAVPPAMPPAMPRTPVLAQIPDLASLGWDAAAGADFAIAHPESHFAQAIDRLERRVAAAAGVIGVTSLQATAGSAVLALNLARAAARRGRKVVLLDAGGQLSQLVGLRPQHGLVDVLAGRVPLANCVIHDPRSAARLLPASATSVSPDAVLCSAALRKLLDALRGSSDLVVLALPAMADAGRGIGAISAASDGTLLLAGWNGVPLPPAASLDGAIASLGLRKAALVVAS
jgi:hypothetical protein